MATTTSPQRAPETSGMALFAGVLLLVAGFFSVIWGLAALLNDAVLDVGGRGVLIADFTTWGWAHMLIGAAMMITAFGLFAMRGWARWVAVFFAMLDIVIQVGAFTAFPLWSMAVIGLDVVIIYQLTVHYESAR